MSKTNSKRIFLIDTDAGLDDAQAITLALSQPDVRVVGITTCHGNSSIKNVNRNVLRLLKVLDRLDIPVYQGAAKSLIGTNGDAEFYHGTDGFGDNPDDTPPDESLLKSTHSANAMIELANKYKGELELIVLGPLTNVAIALRLDENFGKHLKHCYIMGGNITGLGNITISAEYNFYCDPEAAVTVLHDLGCPLTSVGWEACRDNGVSWDQYRELRTIKSKISEFLSKVESSPFKRRENEPGGRGYVMCDEVLMACAIRSDLILESTHVYTTVHLGEGHLRGQSIIDWNNKLKKNKNCVVVQKVDSENYMKLLKKALVS